MERTTTSKIVFLDALFRRVHPNDENKEWIGSLLHKAKFGQKGEERVDRIIKEIQLPSNSCLFNGYEIINDIGNTHQMDTLFVCPHFIFILEIKNVTGYIWYEQEKHQFLRKNLNGEITSFQSPFDQVKRHSDVIERIVERIGLSIPIYKAVVIAEPSTIIGEVLTDMPIFHAVGLPSEFKRLLLKHSNFQLAKSHYELLVETLKSLHLQKVYQPQFEIPPIRKGALCECGQVMTFSKGKFVCSCGIKSKEPFYQGLHDYRILFNEWITNRAFRDFFLIGSGDAANKLLKRMGLFYEGQKSARKYLIPENIWETRRSTMKKDRNM